MVDASDGTLPRSSNGNERELIHGDRRSEISEAHPIHHDEHPCTNSEDDQIVATGASDLGKSPRAPLPFSQTFPSKLYDLLVNAHNNGLAHIVSFQPHGRAFKVHRVFMFESIVLPDFASFQRQLYIYGFRRIAAGPDRQAYYHEHFLRGQPDAVKTISKVFRIEKGTRRYKRILTIPRFDDMPSLPAIEPVMSPSEPVYKDVAPCAATEYQMAVEGDTCENGRPHNDTTSSWLRYMSKDSVVKTTARSCVEPGVASTQDAIEFNKPFQEKRQESPLMLASSFVMKSDPFQDVCAEPQLMAPPSLRRFVPGDVKRTHQEPPCDGFYDEDTSPLNPASDWEYDMARNLSRVDHGFEQPWRMKKWTAMNHYNHSLDSQENMIPIHLSPANPNQQDYQ